MFQSEWIIPVLIQYKNQSGSFICIQKDKAYKLQNMYKKVQKWG